MIKTRKYDQQLISAQIAIFLIFMGLTNLYAQGTQLLRQPDISDTHVTYTYGGDIWVSELNSKDAKRITSTAAVESNPYFSPDGKWIAFSSNRSGSNSVYIVATEGGDARRLTWHPNGALVRGWSNDGKHILYASSRETAPRPYNRLWTISAQGGARYTCNRFCSGARSEGRDRGRDG